MPGPSRKLQSAPEPDSAQNSPVTPAPSFPDGSQTGAITPVAPALEELEFIIRHLAAGLLIWSLDDTEDGKALRLVFSNPAAARILNASLDQYVGKLFSEVLPKLWKAEVSETLRRVIETGTPENLGEIRCGDEHVPDGMLCATAFPLSKNRVAIELTNLGHQREQIEQAIRRQAKLIDLASDAIVGCGLDGKIFCWNEGAQRIYGWTKHEAAGKLLFAIVSTEFPAPFEVIEENLFQAGHWQGELIQRNRDGSEVTVSSHWTLERDADGRPTGWLQINTDVTAERRAQMEFRREKEFSERLINSTIEGIFAFDIECRCTMWNPAMERIFGLRKAEVLGQRAFQVLPFLKETGEERFFKDSLRGKSVVARDRPYQVSGREGFFDAFYSPIFDETGSNVGKGTVIGGLVILHDTTERRQAHEALCELSARLLRSQDEERHRISRELHDSTAQTLYALSLNLVLLEKSALADDPKVAAALLESRSLADRAAQDIRNLSHLLHPPDLDTIGLSPAMRWYASRFSERTGVHVEFELSSELERLHQDTELALFRVFQESLSNVHRHSGSRAVEVRVLTTREGLILEVRDHGRGLSRSAAARYNGNSDGDDVSNLGIGVEGMRARMKQLGGSLEINFTGKGTVVRAKVPLRRPHVR